MERPGRCGRHGAVRAACALGLAACLPATALGGCGPAPGVEALPAAAGPDAAPAARSDLPPLRLRTPDGRPFALEDVRGNAVALFWGYLSCPDICPLTLLQLDRAAALLDDADRARFRVVMVSVDPERDTLDDIGRYLAHHGPAFIGLGGSVAEVASAMATWGVVAERDVRPDGSYTVAHPAQLTLIDPDGRWAETLGADAAPETIAAAVRRAIAAHGPDRPAPDDGPALAPASPRTGLAPDAWLVARHDGSVRRIGPDGEREVLPGWGGRAPEDPVNPGTTLGAPTIGYDPVGGVLWYSDTHESIRSIGTDDGMPGVVLDGFADTAIPGCGVASRGRAFAVDPARRVLYVPMLTGQVLAYDLATRDVRAAIPAEAFGAPVLGRYRLLAVDPGGALWALDATGGAFELDPERGHPTGRAIAARADALAIEPGRGLLVLREPTGVRHVSLRTLRTVVVDAPPDAGPGLAAPLPAAAALGGPTRAPEAAR